MAEQNSECAKQKEAELEKRGSHRYGSEAAGDKEAVSK